MIIKFKGIVIGYWCNGFVLNPRPVFRGGFNLDKIMSAEIKIWLGLQYPS